MKYFVVDRLSDMYVYIEDEEGNISKIRKEFFTSNVDEGHIVYKNEDDLFVIDKNKTLEEKRKIDKDFFSLFS